MSFSMQGSRGTVRMRITPKGYGRGPRGVVGKHEERAYVKARLNNERALFSHPKGEGGVVSKAFGKVKSFFARGNR